MCYANPDPYPDPDPILTLTLPYPDPNPDPDLPDPDPDLPDPDPDPDPILTLTLTYLTLTYLTLTYLTSFLFLAPLGTVCGSYGTCLPFQGCQCTASSGFTGDNCQIPPSASNQTSGAEGGFGGGLSGVGRRGLWVMLAVGSACLWAQHAL